MNPALWSLCVCSYSLTSRSDAPDRLIGNVMSTVLALGSTANDAGSGLLSLSSKSNGIVFGFGFAAREVAAYGTLRNAQSGMRNVDVHPAPRMRTSAGMGGDIDMVVVWERTCCVSPGQLELRTLRGVYLSVPARGNADSLGGQLRVAGAEHYCELKGSEENSE